MYYFQLFAQRLADFIIQRPRSQIYLLTYARFLFAMSVHSFDSIRRVQVKRWGASFCSLPFRLGPQITRTFLLLILI